MNKAIFLDKDGTLIPDIPYNVNPSLITISDDTIEGLQRLRDEGYLFVIISNQSGVARGLFAEAELNGVYSRLQELLQPFSLALSGFYYCPHEAVSEANSAFVTACTCRKPEPGLLIKAAGELKIDLTESWMIGDILNDVEAGNRAGCRTILINNGNETEWLAGPMRSPGYVCSSINQAASDILTTQFA
ncbi:HAD family hydrolase [uncultured Mucilaginibacter sp.]|uniref:D-glycero-alpha-D-manno-heptose-1,7-bisphosphate 7-phosphatase n=1 Tax=uncultured Mucilaginibacter sp. TaxID=797541 RepID=UPI0025F04DCC|nr:HAD family hydrolase [uncultured Mucilaginibacter sp.]